MTAMLGMGVHTAFAAIDPAEDEGMYVKTGAGGLEGGDSKSLKLPHDQLRGKGQDGYPDAGDSGGGEKTDPNTYPSIKDGWSKKSMIEVIDWASRGGTGLDEDENFNDMNNANTDNKQNNRPLVVVAVPKASGTVKLKKINSPLPKMRLRAEAMDGTENGGWSQSPVALKHNDARLKTPRLPAKRHGGEMAPRAVIKGTASSPMGSDLSIKNSKGNDGFVKLAPGPPQGRTGRGTTQSAAQKARQVRSMKRGVEVCETISDIMSGLTAIMALAAFFTPIAASVAAATVFRVGGAGLGLITTSMSIFDTCADDDTPNAALSISAARNIANTEYNTAFLAAMGDASDSQEVLFSQTLSRILRQQLWDPNHYAETDGEIQTLRRHVGVAQGENHMFFTLTINMLMMGETVLLGKSKMMAQCYRTLQDGQEDGQGNENESYCITAAVKLEDDIQIALDHFNKVSPPTNPREPYIDDDGDTEWLVDWLDQPARKNVAITVIPERRRRFYLPVPWGGDTSNFGWCEPPREIRNIHREGEVCFEADGRMLGRVRLGNVCKVEVTITSSILTHIGISYELYPSCGDTTNDCMPWIFRNNPSRRHRYREVWGADHNTCGDTETHHAVHGPGAEARLLSEYAGSEFHSLITRAHALARGRWVNRLREQQTAWWREGVGNVDDFNASREALQQAVHGHAFRNMCDHDCRGLPTIDDANMADQLAKLHYGCRCFMGIHHTRSQTYHCQISHTVSSNPSLNRSPPNRNHELFYIGRTIDPDDPDELFFTHIHIGDHEHKTTVDVKQCRNGEQYWTGLVRIWTSLSYASYPVLNPIFLGERARGSRGPPSQGSCLHSDGSARCVSNTYSCNRRTETYLPPSASNCGYAQQTWLPGDVLVPPSFPCLGVQAGVQEYTCPVTFHCTATRNRHDEPIPFIADEIHRVPQMCGGGWAITVSGGTGANFQAQKGPWMNIFGHDSGSRTMKQCRGSVQITTGNIRWRPGAQGYVRASFYDPSYSARWNPVRGSWNDGDIVILDSHECHELEQQQGLSK